jgi:hypothetical protein
VTRTRVVLIFLLAFAARYAATGAIENDHFVTFTRGLQVFYGDWPVRDFDDPGFPLSYLISTVTAALFGPSLFVNVLLCITLIALTSTITFVLAYRASGSAAVAFMAALITIAVYPRLYNATKVVVPVVAIAAAWRYADAPKPGRLVALALWTATAFLMRHDYAVYVAAGVVALLVLCHVSDLRAMAVRLAAYAALCLLFVAPWLIYVQLFEGVGEYFASAFRFVAAEGRRTTTTLPPAFFMLTAIPVAGLIASFTRSDRLGRTHLVSASVILLTLDVVFLRDVLDARIPDVIAPTTLVAAAIAGRVMSQRAMQTAALVGFVLLIVGAAAVLPARTDPGPSLNAFARAAQIGSRLREVSPEIIPNPSVAPLIAYLSHCTDPASRVLVTGFGPEIPALAHRPFAARLPTWIPGYYEDAADVHRALARLRDERLGAAVFLDGTPVVEHSWPQLMAAIRERGFDEYAPVSDNGRMRVWLPHGAHGARPDIATHLPCAAR